MPPPNGPVKATPLPTALQPANVALAEIVAAIGKLGKASKDAADEAAKSESAFKQFRAALSGVTQGITAAGTIARTATSQLQSLTGAINSQVASFVRLYNPVAVRQFELANNDLTASIGRALVPTLRNFTSLIRGVGDAVASLNPAGQQLIAVLAGAAVGIGVMTAATVALSVAINLATGGIAAAAGLVVGALAGAGAGLALATKDAETFRRAVDLVGRGLTLVGNVVGAVFEKLTAGLGPPVTALLAGLEKIGAGFASAFAANILPLAEMAGNVIGRIITALTPSLLSLADSLGSLLADLGPLVASTVFAQLVAGVALVAAAVEVFARQMKIVAFVIRQVADAVRVLFGLGQGEPAAGLDSFGKDASAGLAVRNTQTSSVDDVVRRARESAFATGGGRGQSPVEKNTGELQTLNKNAVELNASLKAVRAAADALNNTIGQVLLAPARVATAPTRWGMEAIRSVTGV